MSQLIFHHVRSFGIRLFIGAPLCFCLIIPPFLSAQSSDEWGYGKLARRAPGLINISSGVAAGLLLQKSVPVYPAIAKAARVSGTVVLLATISQIGTIENLRVISGPAMLQQAALNAVRTWHYQPYLYRGRPVEVQTTINVVFALGGVDQPLKSASANSAAPASEAQGDTLQTSSSPSFHPGMSEFAAWEDANRSGTPETFREFYRVFPSSPHLKTATGTLRGRYWFKVAQPFGDDGKHRDGVIVTLDGMDIGVNLTLSEAKKLNVIGTTSASETADSDSSGRTFNRIYFEATGGGVLVGNQMVTPKDLQNTLVILSADGNRLLSWDTTNATPSDHPSTQPTIIADANGRYACGDACPAPSDY
jgi:TonB family protein